MNWICDPKNFLTVHPERTAQPWHEFHDRVTPTSVLRSNFIFCFATAENRELWRNQELKLNMNNNQKKILWIGLTVFLLVGIFPPWVQVYDNGKTYNEQDQGYHFIAEPPEVIFDSPTYAEWYKMQFRMKIDVTRLAIQWILTIVIFSGIILSLKQK